MHASTRASRQLVVTVRNRGYVCSGCAGALRALRASQRLIAHGQARRSISSSAGPTANGAAGDIAAAERTATKPVTHHPLPNLPSDGVVRRLSSFWAPTQAALAEGTEGTADLLARAGFVRQTAAGVFQILPLGQRVQAKLEALLDRHMAMLGAGRAALSSLTSEALWRRSGRLADGAARAELFQLVDRRGTALLLSPTHEEEITALVAAGGALSRRDLPLRLYQIGRKFRDEPRARAGLLRAREFVMKDLYTFDADAEAGAESYEAAREAYRRFFAELRLPVEVAQASSGAIGGHRSHEFLLPSPLGEDTVLVCGECGFAANYEVLDVPEAQTPVAQADGASSISTAPDAHTDTISQSSASSTSATSQGSQSTIDSAKVPSASSSQSSTPPPCPSCSSPSTRALPAIELAHTFDLGTRYSEPLGARVAHADGRVAAAHMGCHGVGVTRLVAAAAAHFGDERGLGWPRAIAPFEVAVLASEERTADAERLRAERLPGLDAVVDDRARRLPWKLKDADLVGYPVLVVLGRAWESGRVEVQCRQLGVREEVGLEGLEQRVGELLGRL